MKTQRHQKLKSAATTAGKVAARLAKVIFSIAIAVLAVYLVLSALFGSALGVAHYSVLTGSMGDKIPQGSMVLVVKADFYDLSKGDVIAFTVDLDDDGKKETVTHNFAGYEKIGSETYVITQSEISDKPDRWRIPQADFKGKCVIHVPVLGHISRFLSHPVGVMNLIVNTGIILLVNLILSDPKPEEEERKAFRSASAMRKRKQKNNKHIENVGNI
jgi:signal peptidase I